MLQTSIIFAEQFYNTTIKQNQMEALEGLKSLIILLAIVVGIFLICRNITLWYFRITDIIQKQETTIKETQATNALLKEQLAVSKSQLEQQQFANTLLQDLLKK